MRYQYVSVVNQFGKLAGDKSRDDDARARVCSIRENTKKSREYGALGSVYNRARPSREPRGWREMTGEKVRTGEDALSIMVIALTIAHL